MKDSKAKFTKNGIMIKKKKKGKQRRDEKKMHFGEIEFSVFKCRLIQMLIQRLEVMPVANNQQCGILLIE